MFLIDLVLVQDVRVSNENYCKIDNYLCLLKISMTHILDGYFSSVIDIDEDELINIANKFPLHRRKKMTEEQICFVQNILPIYLENEILRMKLPQVMEIYGFPSPYSTVFCMGNVWQ